MAKERHDVIRYFLSVVKERRGVIQRSLIRFMKGFKSCDEGVCAERRPHQEGVVVRVDSVAT